MVTLWWLSYRSRRPRRMATVMSTSGAGTWIGANRRSGRRPSRRTCGTRPGSWHRWSAVRRGPTWALRMLAASMAPRRRRRRPGCISSMNRMMSPRVRISFSTFFRRSSKSPRYRLLATSAPRSRVELLVAQVSGTSPVMIFCASDSTTAVLLTPAPRSARVVLRAARQHLHDALDLFVAADHRIQRTSLPPGSDCGRTGRGPANPTASLPAGRRRWRLLALVTGQQLDHLLPHRLRSAPSFTRTCAATPSPSRMRPSRMCSVPM